MINQSDIHSIIRRYNGRCPDVIIELLQQIADDLHERNEQKPVAWVSKKAIHQFPDMSAGYEPLYLRK